MTHFTKLFLRRALCCMVLFMLAAFTGVKAAPDSKGSDFWITFPGNFDDHSTLTLFITGDMATTGVVTIPGLSFSRNFSVTPGTITSVVVPAEAQLSTSNTVESKGIHITSQQEVTVYGLNRLQFTTDAFLALPTDILGTEYINLGYQNSLVPGTQLGIVGTVNGTTVTITPKVSTEGHPAGVPYTITLNQGQTYLLVNTSAGADLSGSIITANHPIAVFGGHQCTNVPPNTVYCDYIVEQLPPTSAWGKHFATMPLATRRNGDTFRIMASANNTQVSVNGSMVATLSKGQFHERIINGPSVITATEPVLVAQYSNGGGFDGVVADPFMMLIPPFEQFLGSYTVATPATGFRSNFINVVAPTVSIGTIKLNGTAIPAARFMPIGTSGFSGAQLPVPLGTHNLTGDNFPFGAFVYGFDQDDSYGYPGGQSLSPVATVRSVTINLQGGSTARVGTEHCMIATARDQNNQPVAGIRIDFAIIGANTQSGFATTDASGQARFCYTGTKVGEDNITAASGAVMSNARLTWTATPCNISLTTTQTNVTTHGGNNGAIDLTVSGGTTPYTFSWSNGRTTEDISGLTAGVYTVTVTDANNCSAQTSVTITQPSAPPPPSGCTLALTTKVTQAEPWYGMWGAFNGAGSIDLTVMGGTAPYTYRWNAGVATQDLSLASPGYYSVTVTDANGCTGTTTAYVGRKNDFLRVLSSHQNVSTAGGSDGAIDLTVVGGVVPATFMWSNGATTEDLAGLSAGTYKVIVTDAFGRKATTTVVISEPGTPLSLSVAHQNVSAAGRKDGAVDLTVVGGTAPYTYRWNTGATTEDLHFATPGDYSVTVTDANGAMATAMVRVEVGRAPIVMARKPATGDDLFTTTTAGLTAYPNPATERTTISFSLQEAGKYSLDLYDLRGAKVKTLSAGKAEANQALNLDLEVANFAKGVYLLKLVTDKGASSKRLLVGK